MPNDRQGAMGTNRNIRNSTVMYEKTFLLWGFQLEQITQRYCGVAILGDSENLTGHIPEQAAPGDTALSNGVGLDDLQRSLLISAIQWFWESVIMKYLPCHFISELLLKGASLLPFWSKDLQLGLLVLTIFMWPCSFWLIQQPGLSWTTQQFAAVTVNKP